MPHLVLLEDNPADIALFQILLGEVSKEYRLDVFKNGEDAIHFMEGASQEGAAFLAGIILDLNVPKKDGFEVLKWLRANPEYIRIPVVIYTSSESDEDKEKAEKENAHFFSKTIDISETRKTIVKMIQLFQ